MSRLLNLREAERELGLSAYQIYSAVERGLLHAVQVNGRGRIYYPEWELRCINAGKFCDLAAA